MEDWRGRTPEKEKPLEGSGPQKMIGGERTPEDD